ncbi:MAG: hypothetical protein MJE12_28690 [Alphaproteobacteria bacterium]|nr:hypothetical protein [Alphaproteobacteria bacterium]
MKDAQQRQRIVNQQRLQRLRKKAFERRQREDRKRRTEQARNTEQGNVLGLAALQRLRASNPGLLGKRAQPAGAAGGRGGPPRPPTGTGSGGGPRLTKTFNNASGASTTGKFNNAAGVGKRGRDNWFIQRRSNTAGTGGKSTAGKPRTSDPSHKLNKFRENAKDITQSRVKEPKPAPHRKFEPRRDKWGRDRTAVNLTEQRKAFDKFLKANPARLGTKTPTFKDQVRKDQQKIDPLAPTKKGGGALSNQFNKAVDDPTKK